MYEPLFLPSCDVFLSTASVDCLVLPAQSTPRCMNVSSWWLNLFFVSQYISIFGQLSHIIPTFKKMVSWCHWAMLSTTLSTIDHLQVEMVGTHLSQQVYSLVNYVQVRWSTQPSFHKVFVGCFPSVHLLWKVTWLYVLRFHLQSFLRT